MPTNYYVPKLKDLPVGITVITKLDDDQWSEPYEAGLSFFINMDIKRLIRKKRIMIKHLDQSDIESFGFELIKETESHSYNEYTLVIKKHFSAQVIHLHHREGSDRYLSMVVLKQDGSRSYDVIGHFLDINHPKIEIKNKRELSKYLEQCNYIEEEEIK